MISSKKNQFVIFTLLLTIISSISTHAQSPLNNNPIHIRDGYYLSLEDFRNNQPTYPINGKEYKSLNGINSFKLGPLKLKDGEDSVVIASKSILFISINNTIFINHEPIFQNKKNSPISVFFKIIRIGNLSRYFVSHEKMIDLDENELKVIGLSAFLFTGYGFYVKQRQSPANYTQFIFHLESGKSYYRNSGSKDLISIIRQDPYFAESKIKNKNLDLYIGEYNLRNPPVFDSQK